MRGLFHGGWRHSRTGVGVAFGQPSVLGWIPKRAQRGPANCSEFADADAGLVEAVRTHRLKGACATLVLAPDEYRLVMIEPPDVPAEELAQACRWRIRDLIDFSLADAVVEVFRPGGERRSEQDHLVYVAAAHQESIRARLRQVDAAGLRTVAVDIPELALRNLATAMPLAAEGLALLHLNAAGARIVLVRGAHLYMTRYLTLALTEPLTSASVDQVTLELQRSLDYYDSHFRAGPIRTLAVLETAWLDESALPRLSEDLAVDVVWFGLGDLFPGYAAGADTAGDDCAIALGAALRGAA